MITVDFTSATTVSLALEQWSTGIWLKASGLGLTDKFVVSYSHPALDCKGRERLGRTYGDIAVIPVPNVFFTEATFSGGTSVPGEVTFDKYTVEITVYTATKPTSYEAGCCEDVDTHQPMIAMLEENGGGGTASSVAWADVTGKPSTFTPASHTHDGTDINTGTLPGTALKDYAIYAGKIADGAVITRSISDLQVTEAKLAASAVTTAKIADANVTAGKLASNAVTTAKIADSNVTSAKLAASGATAGTYGSNAGYVSRGSGFNIAQVTVNDKGLVTSIANRAIIPYNQTSLYSNSSGTTGTVTLSQSVANFNYLSIYYGYAGFRACYTVDTVGSSSYAIALSLAYPDGTTNTICWYKTRYVQIKGTSITNQISGGYIFGSSQGCVTNSTEIVIYKVLGHH